MNIKNIYIFLILLSFIFLYPACEPMPDPTPTPEITPEPTPEPENEYGSGADGALNVNSSIVVNTVKTTLKGEHLHGRLYIEVASITGISAGDELFICNTRGSGAGTYEFVTITQVNTFTCDLETALFNSYPADDSVFVYRVPHYTDVIVQEGGMIIADTWNGSTGGGVVVFRATGSINISGNGGINVSEKGYQGHNRQADNANGFQGEGYLGIGIQSVEPNGNGGGGGVHSSSGGGGGGHYSVGTNGEVGFNDIPERIGKGGLAVGTPELASIFFGGAGGTGADNDSNEALNPNGGHGGGLIYIASPLINIKNVLANGGAGKEGSPGSQDGGSGGGAGGSIYIIGDTVNITGDVTAIGGIGFTPLNEGGKGGDGSVGRIRIKADTIVGITIPAAYTD
ncbi:MAG: hypothetical protein JXJ04_21315 [Spirochaetales bacterium]|nr:hypothetical protein [Spirochaetales bacterium]